MLILLVRPSAPNKFNLTGILDCEPLELEYLYTTALQLNHKIHIYDSILDTYSLNSALLFNPDVICVTGYIAQEKSMLEICKIAKQTNNNIITIIGGVHAQLSYKRFYNQNVDYILRSESMQAFKELLIYVEHGDTNINKINGLCYRVGHSYKENAYSATDINSLPIPDRTYFNNNKSRFNYLDMKNVATIKTALSCPFSCTFCYCCKMNNSVYSARKLELVIEELKTIDSENVMINDDDFLLDKKRVEDFIELIKLNNITKKYLLYSRVDFISENKDLLSKLKDIGVEYIVLGLESLDDEKLKTYNKKVTVDKNRQAIRIMADLNIKSIGLFIIPPDATIDTFRNIYNWVKHTEINYAIPTIFTPLPATDLYEDYKDKITSCRISDWDFMHLVVPSSNLSKNRFYFNFYWLYLKLYLIGRKKGNYQFITPKDFFKMSIRFLLRLILKENES